MRLHKLAFISIGLVSICAFAQAETLNFDDITTNNVALISNGYGDMDWQNMYVTAWSLNPRSWQGYGYENGCISPDYVALDGMGAPAKFSTMGGAPTITCFSGYFTAAWTNDLTLTVQGIVNGNVVQTFTTDLVYTAPEFYKVQFSQGVDTVRFLTSTPTDPDNANFAVDNLTINPAATPEPATVAALGLGVVGCVGCRRRRPANA